jgi:hypothetical protein
VRGCFHKHGPRRVPLTRIASQSDLSPQAGRGDTYAATQTNPLPLRRILPVDGEGKCAVQHSVSVSQ